TDHRNQSDRGGTHRLAKERGRRAGTGQRARRLEARIVCGAVLSTRGSNIMIKRELLGAVFCLPLATMMLWQGSSCKSTKANLNSARSDNQPMSNNSTRQNTTDLKGTWGGDHISME